MKKLCFSALSALLAFSFFACSDSDSDSDTSSSDTSDNKIHEFAECSQRNQTVCQDGLLYECVYDYIHKFDNVWKITQCNAGFFCKSFENKAGCFKTCDESQVGKTDGEFSTCRKLDDGTYYYVN